MISNDDSHQHHQHCHPPWLDHRERIRLDLERIIVNGKDRGTVGDRFRVMFLGVYIIKFV